LALALSRQHNQVGAEIHYVDRPHCMNVTRYDAEEDLDQGSAAVDQNDLRECVAAIVSEDRADPFRGLAHGLSPNYAKFCGGAPRSWQTAPGEKEKG
jgi:hypothetical protein